MFHDVSTDFPQPDESTFELSVLMEPDLKAVRFTWASRRIFGAVDLTSAVQDTPRGTEPSCRRHPSESADPEANLKKPIVDICMTSV